MNRLLRNVFALVVMLVSVTAFAGETRARARGVTYSCMYYSAQEAEVELSYVNTGLPWGTSVTLIYGWGGSVSPGGGAPPYLVDWENTTATDAPATAPYTWGTTVKGQTASRGSPSKSYNRLDFVWEVHLPDGSVFYEKGNNSTWGYYLADVSSVPKPCTSTGGFNTELQPVPVTSVEKW
ncbi:hypothetical protein ACLESD_06190 [Pyxidicoccus sp. 3LFB2]